MIEVLKQALDALETEVSIDWTNNDEFNASAEKMHDAITSLQQAIKELESQEPVACGTYQEVTDTMNALWAGTLEQVQIAEEMKNKKLYTAPSQRTWQGLTQSDFNEIYDLFANKVSSDFIFEKMYSTIEAKLKERNI